MMIIRFHLRRIALLLLAIGNAQLAIAQDAVSLDAALIEQGRYLARIAGCNDCHTAGYALTGGQVPESEWLLGDALGWRGDWGTTYPTNLRLYLNAISEEDWLAVARNARFRPPMPWFALRDMSENDLRALYRFVRYLGPGGQPAPAYLPPQQSPTGAFVQFPMAAH